MKTSEQAISEGFFDPPSRLIVLCLVSYLAGIFYPMPNTAFHLIKGPTVEGNTTTIHTPDFIDPAVIPFILSPFAGSAFVAVPVSVFCILCSALDRWHVAHVTALGAASTFSMGFAWDITDTRAGETFIYVLSTAAILGVYALLANRLAEQAADTKPDNVTS